MTRLRAKNEETRARVRRAAARYARWGLTRATAKTRAAFRAACQEATDAGIAFAWTEAEAELRKRAREAR
jgi:hypothetical protein